MLILESSWVRRPPSASQKGDQARDCNSVNATMGPRACARGTLSSDLTGEASPYRSDQCVTGIVPFVSLL